MDDRDTLRERIVALESALAHHQREYDELNEVVIEQARSIELLSRRLQKLEAALEDVRQHLPDERDAEEERPPHY